MGKGNYIELPVQGQYAVRSSDYHFLSQCVRKNSTPGGHNDIKNLGVIRYHPEIEDVIRPVGVAPLDLPTDDQITHMVADIVLAVNDEHYSVLYLGTGVFAYYAAVHHCRRLGAAFTDSSFPHRCVFAAPIKPS